MWDINIMFTHPANACEMYNYTLGIQKKKWSAESEQRQQIWFFTLATSHMMSFKNILLSENSSPDSSWGHGRN